jgi:shikimate kinase
MKIFIVGVACVGKTTIGRKLAERLKFEFYDFDGEVENYFNLSIERLKNQHFTEYFVS